MQLKSPSPLPAVIIISAVLLFSLLTSCRPDRQAVSETDMHSLEKWLNKTPSALEDLLADDINTGRSLVMVQDNVLRDDTVELMRTLVPVSYDLGVRILGLFFLDTAQQEELDNFILNGSNTTPAEKLLFLSDAASGYAEYRDFITYIQDFNKRLSSEETPMRVMALKDKRQISPDVFFDTAGLTEVITEKSDDSDTEAPEMSPPVLLWITADDLQYLPGLEKISDPVNKPVILVHHGPKNGSLRWNGLMETVSAKRDIRERTFAFRTDTPPFEGWSSEAPESKGDIYIVTAFPYRSVCAIPDFITPETALPALKFFPEIKMEKPLSWAAFRMNRITKKAADRYSRMTEELDLPGSSD